METWKGNNFSILDSQFLLMVCSPLCFHCWLKCFVVYKLIRDLHLSSEQWVTGSSETGNVECLKARICHKNGTVNTCGTQEWEVLWVMLGVHHKIIIGLNKGNCEEECLQKKKGKGSFLRRELCFIKIWSMQRLMSSAQETGINHGKEFVCTTSRKTVFLANKKKNYFLFLNWTSS